MDASQKESTTRKVTRITSSYRRILPAAIISFIIASFFCKRNLIDSIVITESLSSFHAVDHPFAPVPTSKPRGVFVLKVSNTEQLEKTLCTLNVFFNARAKYPIRIFTDYAVSNNTDIAKYTGNTDVKIILNERWKDLPPSLTKRQQKQVMAQCRDFDDKEKARCTSLKKSLGYIFNTYWTYMEMAEEVELQAFDYFVLIDNDAFMTRPMPDPFQIMEQNNLVGIYNIESMEGGLTSGVQEAVEASFTVDERRSAFLNSPDFPMFDDNGIWGGKDHRKPGVWMCFFGGRLDFLRSTRFKDFARQLPFHTYMSRTSRQSVVPVGWSILAGGRKVWYLPKRGIDMGIYHHGWVDDSEIIRQTGAIHSGFSRNTLLHWRNFTESRVNTLLTWKEYMEAQPTTVVGTDWRRCIDARGSKYGS